MIVKTNKRAGQCMIHEISKQKPYCCAKACPRDRITNEKTNSKL
jgi:hypothetical protein